MSKRPPSPHDRPSTIQEALERAALALRAQRFEEAEHLAADVVKSNRGNVLAAQLLGQALLLQARPEAAIEPLRSAARRSQDPTIETLLARAFTDAGRDDEALVCSCIRRRSAGPVYPLAFVELGDLLRKLGRLDGEALEVFERGLAAGA